MLDRLSEQQMILLVILFGCCSISHSLDLRLWDPWETHYGEVARQMVTRGDFISLWWPGSPSTRGLLVQASPHLLADEYLDGRLRLRHPSPETFALSSRPEWALRLPFCLMSLLALVGVYLAVSRFVSRRAGSYRCCAGDLSMFSLVARQP